MGAYLSTEIEWESGGTKQRQWHLAAPPGSRNEAAIFRLYLALVDAYVVSNDTPWRGSTASLLAPGGDAATILMATPFKVKPLRFESSLTPQDVFGSMLRDARRRNVSRQIAHVAKSHPPAVLRRPLPSERRAGSADSSGSDRDDTSIAKEGVQTVTAPNLSFDENKLLEPPVFDALADVSEALCYSLPDAFFDRYVVDEGFNAMYCTQPCEPKRLQPVDDPSQTATPLMPPLRPVNSVAVISPYGAPRAPPPIPLERPDEFAISVWDRRGDGRYHGAVWSLKGLVEYLALACRFRCPDVDYRRVRHSRTSDIAGSVMSGGTKDSASPRQFSNPSKPPLLSASVLRCPTAATAAQANATTSPKNNLDASIRTEAPTAKHGAMAQYRVVDLNEPLQRQGVVGAVSSGAVPALFIALDTASVTHCLAVIDGSAEHVARARTAIVTEMAAMLRSLVARADPTDPASSDPGDAIVTELVYLLCETPEDAQLGERLSPEAWRARAPRSILEGLLHHLRFGAGDALESPSTRSGIRLLGSGGPNRAAADSDGSGSDHEATQAAASTSLGAAASLKSDVPRVDLSEVLLQQAASVDDADGVTSPIIARRPPSRGSQHDSSVPPSPASSPHTGTALKGTAQVRRRSVKLDPAAAPVTAPRPRHGAQSLSASQSDTSQTETARPLAADLAGLRDPRWAALSPSEIASAMKAAIDAASQEHAHAPQPPALAPPMDTIPLWRRAASGPSAAGENLDDLPSPKRTSRVRSFSRALSGKPALVGTTTASTLSLTPPAALLPATSEDPGAKVQGLGTQQPTTTAPALATEPAEADVEELRALPVPEAQQHCLRVVAAVAHLDAVLVRAAAHMRRQQAESPALPRLSERQFRKEVDALAAGALAGITFAGFLHDSASADVFGTIAVKIDGSGSDGLHSTTVRHFTATSRGYVALCSQPRTSAAAAPAVAPKPDAALEILALQLCSRGSAVSGGWCATGHAAKRHLAAAATTQPTAAAVLYPQTLLEAIRRARPQTFETADSRSATPWSPLSPRRSPTPKMHRDHPSPRAPTATSVSPYRRLQDEVRAAGDGILRQAAAVARGAAAPLLAAVLWQQTAEDLSEVATRAKSPRTGDYSSVASVDGLAKTVSPTGDLTAELAPSGGTTTRAPPACGTASSPAPRPPTAQLTGSARSSAAHRAAVGRAASDRLHLTQTTASANRSSQFASTGDGWGSSVGRSAGSLLLSMELQAAAASVAGHSPRGGHLAADDRLEGSYSLAARATPGAIAGPGKLPSSGLYFGSTSALRHERHCAKAMAQLSRSFRAVHSAPPSWSH
jgi:hypothetical protein